MEFQQPQQPGASATNALNILGAMQQIKTRQLQYQRLVEDQVLGDIERANKFLGMYGSKITPDNYEPSRLSLLELGYKGHLPEIKEFQNDDGVVDRDRLQSFIRNNLMTKEQRASSTWVGERDKDGNITNWRLEPVDVANKLNLMNPKKIVTEAERKAELAQETKLGTIKAEQKAKGEVPGRVKEALNYLKKFVERDSPLSQAITAYMLNKDSKVSGKSNIFSALQEKKKSIPQSQQNFYNKALSVVEEYYGVSKPNKRYIYEYGKGFTEK